MRTFSYLAAAAAVAISSPALAAETIELEREGNTLSGEFTGEADDAGDFTSIFTFMLPRMGETSVSVTTTATNNPATNIDFTSVLLNGTPLSIVPLGRTEVAFIDNFATSAGQQTLTINGTSGGNAGFGGNITFAAAGAIPEPGTWALLILGFGTIGFAMRRRSQQVRSTRAKINFA